MDPLSIGSLFTLEYSYVFIYRVYVLVGYIYEALRSLIHQFCSSNMYRHDNIYLGNIRFALLNFYSVYQSDYAKKWFSTIYWEIGNWKSDRIHKLHSLCDFTFGGIFLVQPVLLSEYR